MDSSSFLNFEGIESCPGDLYGQGFLADSSHH